LIPFARPCICCKVGTPARRNAYEIYKYLMDTCGYMQDTCRIHAGLMYLQMFAIHIRDAFKIMFKIHAKGAKLERH